MEYEYMEDETSRPTMRRMRSGMFSAEDGLFLACFLAVIIVVAGAIRFFCRRYCANKCSKCKHKQDPSPDGTDHQIPSVIIDTHRPEDSNTQFHQQHRSSGSSVSTSITMSNDGANVNSGFLCAPAGSEANSTRRGSNSSMVHAIPTMQTVYEEEENEDAQEEPSRLSSCSLSCEESGTVHTVYHFPQNATPTTTSQELFRTSPAPSDFERRVSFTAGTEKPDTFVPIKDSPPSYEDLFPTNNESSKPSKQKFDLENV